MGLQNFVTRNYMSRNDIFAEVVNYYIFSVRKVIRPEDLSEETSAENIILSQHGKKPVFVEKYRDILKQSIFKKMNKPVPKLNYSTGSCLCPHISQIRGFLACFMPNLTTTVSGLSNLPLL